MLSLSAKTRKIFGKKSKKLREKGIIPAVLYGPKIKESLSLEIDLKEFEKIFKEAGESSLISLQIGDKREGALVLIHDIKKNSLTLKPIHVDFYQPNLEKEIEAKVPLVFEGEALAVKDLGGTLVKNILEVRVKAKPQNLPKEIKLTIENLKTLDDNIIIKDLQVPEGVKVLQDPKEIVVFIAPPQKIEEELARPIEEKRVEEVKKVEEKKAEEEETKAKPQ